MRETGSPVIKRSMLLVPIAALLLGCTPTSPAESMLPATPSAAIAPGVQPSQRPSDVVTFAIAAATAAIDPGDRGKQPIRVSSISAVHGGSWIGPYDQGVTWIVVLEGPFAENVGPPGMRSLEPAPRLRLLISDYDPTSVMVAFER
jgi:hypothetical protein